MRGKKGVPHTDPKDPPRRRANKARGHGSWETDRPPALGIVGRESGQVYLEVIRSSSKNEILPKVIEQTAEGSAVYTDEWRAYDDLESQERIHESVCHKPGERIWARDLDGDGIREVHNNTIEGFWTGLRNFLRMFRGVSKKYLGQYLAMHQWAHNLKQVTSEFLRILCGCTQFQS